MSEYTPYFDSQQNRFKSPIGACKTDERVSFLVRVEDFFTGAFFEYNEIDDQAVHSFPMTYVGHEGARAVYAIRMNFDHPCVVLYRFRLTTQDGTVRFLNRGALQRAQLDTHPGTPFQQTVYDKDYRAPEGFAGGVMYQIFPDRFFAYNTTPDPEKIMRDDWGGVPFYNDDRFHPEQFIGSDFFGGNLQGIIQKLPYLQSLSVSLIYLNPLFKSPSNHHYDTADFMTIDPVLGTEDDFRALCDEAHKRGIKVILDGVFSHVGADSVYFDLHHKHGELGAYHNENSPYRRWFSFDNSDIGYKCWWGVFSLPEVNESEYSYREFICGKDGVLAHWLHLGADGFRLDVADELPDDFLDAVNNRIKTENPTALLIGEVWEDATTKHSHGGRRRYFLGRQLDGVMNYPFKNAVLDFMLHRDAMAFAEVVTTLCNNYPAPMLNHTMNFLSTHDTMRALTVLSGSTACNQSRPAQAKATLSQEEYARGAALLKPALTLLFMLSGIPSLFYGDEVGLSGFADPFNRACFPWGKEDGDLLAFVRNLCQFRSDYRDILRDGSLHIRSCDGAVLVLERVGREHSLTCTVNLSDFDITPDATLYKQIAFGQLVDGKISPLSAVIGWM